MHRILLPGLLTIVFLTGGSSPWAEAKGDPLAKAAAKQKAKIAKVYLDLARYLAGRDLKTEAQAALAEAEALDPEGKVPATLATSIEGLAGEGSMDGSTEARIAKAKKGAAKGYEKLAGVFAKEADDPRFARYLVKAISLESTKKRLAKFGDAAKKGLLLVQGPTHPMAAYLSFPKAWKPGGSWPVLVGVDGAGAGFKGCAKRFASPRGKRPFIVVSPHAMSCTNAINPKKFPAYDQVTIDEWSSQRTAFDVPGLLALLDFLHEQFGAEKKIAITGFSGGGNLCYGFLLRHPDRVFCAAPACANFNPGLANGAAKPDDGGPPIHIMTGSKDPHRDLTHGKEGSPGIEPQSDWAEKALAENGFDKVKRTMLDGVGHSALPREVWEYVDEVRGD